MRPTLIETTWQYVNREGGPDRRFKGNRQIPVLLYSVLDLVHTDFRVRLQFSRRDAAANATAALSAFRRVVAGTGTTATHPATETADVDHDRTVTTAPAAVETLAARIEDALALIQRRLEAVIGGVSSAGSGSLSVPDSFTWLREHMERLQRLNAETVDLCRDRLGMALRTPPPEASPESYRDEW